MWQFKSCVFLFGCFYNLAVYQKDMTDYTVKDYFFKVSLGPSSTGDCCLQIQFPACNTAPAFLVTRRSFKHITSQSEFNQNNRNTFSFRLLLYNPIVINNEVIWYRSQGFIQEVRGLAFRILKINLYRPSLPWAEQRLGRVALFPWQLGGWKEALAWAQSAVKELVWAGWDNPLSLSWCSLAHVDRCRMRM